MKELRKQIIYFSMVGTVATAAQYVVLMILVELFHQPPVFSSSVGFVFGGFFSYYLNHRLTFQSDKKHRIAMIQFICVAAVSFWLNGILMSIGVNRLHLDYVVAQILTTGSLLFWTFLANRFWTFRARSS